MDDFGSGGYYSGPSLPECTESNDASNPEDIRYPNYLNKTFDSEPDIFTYNFNNMSGRFFFEQNKDRETGPRADISSDSRFSTHTAIPICSNPGSIRDLIFVI